MACPQQGLPGSEQGTVVDLQEKSLSTGEHPGEPHLMQSTAEPQERAEGRAGAMHSHCYSQLPTNWMHSMMMAHSNLFCSSFHARPIR